MTQAQFLESLPCAAALLGPAPEGLAVVGFNEAFCALTGWKHTTLARRSAVELCCAAPEEVHRVAEFLRAACAAEGEPLRYTAVSKNGARTFLAKAAPYTALPGGCCVVLEDATEEQKNLDCMQEARALCDKLIENAGLSVWKYNIVTRTLYGGRGRCTAYALPEVCTDFPDRLLRSGKVRTDSTEELRALFQRLECGVNPTGADIWFCAEDGTWKCERISCVVSFDEAGRPAVATGVSRDVTEELNAKSECRKVELAMRNSDIVVWEYDIVNGSAALQAGSTARSDLAPVFEGSPERIAESGVVQKESVEDFLNLYADARRGVPFVSGEVHVHSKKRQDIWLRMSLNTIFDSHGCPVRAVGCAADVTEIREARRRYEDEERYQDALQGKDLLAKARLNLTKDFIENYRAAEGVGVATESASYSLLLDALSKTALTAAQSEELRTRLSRSRLLKAFERGDSFTELEYQRRMGDDVHWVRLRMKLYRNTLTGDVMCFVYTNDINEMRTNRSALQAVASRNYDFIGIINCLTDNYYCVTRGDCEYLPPAEAVGYDSTAVRLAEEWRDAFVTEEDYRLMHESFLMANLTRELETQSVCQYNVKMWDGKHRFARTYQQSFCYLDAEHTQVMVCRADVTKSVLEEQNKQEMLRSALEQANQASRAKTDFLSRMSHEIRTPMNAIIGMSALAAQCVNDPDQVADCISKVGISARFLLSLINDILDMSRIESGKLTVKNEKIPFEEFVNGINAICYEQATQKSVDYDCIIASFTEDYYVGDAMKLQQVLLNLLSNAIKFTPRGGKVQFIICQERTENGHAYMKFTVNDTGVGIREENLERIFEPFEQANSNVAGTYGGTGLGLAICQNLVTMMGGHMAVNSIEGVGSEFTVELALELCDERKHVTVGRAQPDLKKLAALIVDDEIIICEHTKAILTDMGMKAEWVDSGYKAVETVRERWNAGKHFDIVLIDWKMPGMNGIETARRIREIVGPDVTIIIMTAYDWVAIEAEAKRAGVNMLISKPLFKNSLLSAFERVYTGKNEKAAREQPAVYDFKGRHVLLVEDHLLNIEVARRLLESKGAQVEVAENGIAAIEVFTLAEPDHFDAILMDIRMPVMDGLTAARSIRQLRKKTAKTIPIIAMSANAFDEDVEKSRAAGMNAHLAKPIEPEMLFRTLNHYFEENDAERNAAEEGKHDEAAKK